MILRFLQALEGGWGVPPPPRAALAVPDAVVSAGGGGGAEPMRHLLDLPLWCPRGGSAEPRRHLFSLPRGRGPSQTPKFLSPGPPSPWLPALPIERRFCRFCAELEIPKAHPRRAPQWQGQPVPLGFSPRGCKGRSPLHKIT